jgi:hypothetical protein
MRREVLAFCLIGAWALVSVLTEYGWIPDPEPDAPSGGPPEFALGALFAIIAFLLPRAKPQIGLARPVRIWRRGLAFCVDAFVAGFTTGMMMGLIGTALGSISPEMAEYLSRKPDRLVNSELEAAIWFIAVSLVFCYFWLHAKYGHATLGQYIMGYWIEIDPDTNIPPHHFMRTVLAYFAVCSWHLWGWFVKYEDTQQGRYWWDRIGQTHAVFVGPY